MEELQGTQPEHKPSEMKSELVQTQSWRYKTIVVIKHQQQTTISIEVITVKYCCRCYRTYCSLSLQMVAMLFFG